MLYKEDPTYPELLSDCYKKIDKLKSLAVELAYRAERLSSRLHENYNQNLPGEIDDLDEAIAKARKAGL